LNHSTTTSHWKCSVPKPSKYCRIKSGDTFDKNDVVKARGAGGKIPLETDHVSRKHISYFDTKSGRTQYPHGVIALHVREQF